jgi:hypothetical protein
MWQLFVVILILIGAALYLVFSFGRKLVGKTSKGCGFCPCPNKGKPGGAPPCLQLDERVNKYGQIIDKSVPPCYKCCMRAKSSLQKEPKE